MVAGSPVQGLTSSNSSVTPWNGIVVDVAWAKAGPAMSPSSRGTSSKNSFRAIRHSLPAKTSEGWRDREERVGLGSQPQVNSPVLPSGTPRFVRSTRGNSRKKPGIEAYAARYVNPPNDD